MATSLPPAFAVSALYDRLLQTALRRFFDRAVLETTHSSSVSSAGELSIEPTEDPAALSARWLGTRHVLRVPAERPFSAHETRMAQSIAGVLQARFDAVFDPKLMIERADLFQGTLEDRYIGAFLDGGRYATDAGPARAEQVASAIEVLRVAALSSYENRAISSGVLLLDGDDDPFAQRKAPAAPLTYSQGLTAVKSFYRLCDGLNTVVLVNRRGHLVDIVDIARWGEQSSGGRDLDVPCASVFRPHALATLRSRHVCVVLSPNHEIKVFAEGTQAFSFRAAAWHLLDLSTKYAMWTKAVGNPVLAQRLFQVALDLADHRTGALFVVLRNAMSAMAELVMPADLIMDNPARPASTAVTRRDFSYLLTSRSVISMDQSVLEGLASIDGATVCDRDGRLVAVGAILRHPAQTNTGAGGAVAEGARSTAALAASRFGPVMKVSEDGVITCFDRVKLWEL